MPPMKRVSEHDTIQTMNELGATRTPFLFIIAYDKSSNYVIPLKDVDPEKIRYTINGLSNVNSPNQEKQNPAEAPLHWTRYPLSFEQYEAQFNPLMHALKSGEIHLANLTFQTEVACNLSLKTIYERTQAKYRLWVNDPDHEFECVCFSPETFVKIDGKTGSISSFPMKGTIDATLENAEKQLLDNPKEQKEHETIVAETQKDLALVSSDIDVARYRFIDRVETHNGPILQSSSEISGKLPKNFHAEIGTLLSALLPAGSITGAPRARATEIINAIERYDRGFYSGIAGLFDGENIESFVLIRFLEKIKDKLYFKSGGGITADSQPFTEYEEMKQKIYVPIY